ncbi:MAG: cobalamin biosynthesis protein CbiD, partial [Pseudobutyrivibrio sp.]|nr:cobalamin biosynthesis protein CbiD [Pseudobutyrivibrio sp.]
MTPHQSPAVTASPQGEAKRKGFTTGSCSAAAAKAATYMLLSGKEKLNIEIETPAGIMFNADIVDIKRLESQVSCAVIKDGGDDPDVTTGSHVVATVSMVESCDTGDCAITIDGGFGVGRVTLPGLDQPVGNAAINHVPREMIEKEVLQVCKLFDFCGKLSVIISVPEGKELASHTFNPRLGIVGGISILGTTGIVEPMSAKALVDTIRVELSQKKALGFKTAFVTPGNYGLKFMKDNYDYDLDKSVKCSNFIGETVDMVCEMGFETLVI